MLTVVGLRAGAAVVSLRYQQPQSDEWLAAKLSVEFLPERTLAPLALGQHVPAGPARLDHVSEAFAAAGVRAPLHCEPQDAYRETFICFAADTSAGVPRYPSCEHTPRCRGGGAPPFGGFVARVRAQNGLVTRIDSSLEVEGSVEATDVWETPDDKDASP
jgi:hypothetical protein